MHTIIKVYKHTALPFFCLLPLGEEPLLVLPGHIQLKVIMIESTNMIIRLFHKYKYTG